MGLHDFAQCDTTSCFAGTGKVKPIKILDKNDPFEILLSQIGSTFSVSANLEVELEEIVCLLYSRKHHKEINKLRLSILQEKCGGNRNKISIQFGKSSSMQRCFTATQTKSKLPGLIDFC